MVFQKFASGVGISHLDILTFNERLRILAPELVQTK